MSYLSPQKMKTNIDDRALEIEKYFCEENLLRLRQGFPWIERGIYIAEYDTYAPTDAAVVYKMGNNRHAGLCDFKYTDKYDVRSLSKYTLSATCARELEKDPSALLFVYSDATQMLYCISIAMSEIEYTRNSEEKEVGIITNLSQCIIEQRNWPLS